MKKAFIVYRGVNSPHKTRPLFLVYLLALPLKIMTLKPLLHLFAPPSPIDKTTMIRPLTVSSNPWFHRTNLCQAIHFLPLSYNLTNIKELCNRGHAVEVTTKDIKKEDRICMKPLTPETQCAYRVFRIKPPGFSILGE